MRLKDFSIIKGSRAEGAQLSHTHRKLNAVHTELGSCKSMRASVPSILELFGYDDEGGHQGSNHYGRKS